MTADSADVAIVGGGHNGLVAAAYLGRAGLRVVVLEARDQLGGAVASARPFAGVDVVLSRYSYLVSLLPETIVHDLELDLELRSRRIASYTPVGDGGLLVERAPGPATRASFRELTGDDRAYEPWIALESRLREFAAVVEPTLTQPLPSAQHLRGRIPGSLWHDFVERPLGEVLERTFADDTVRGVVLTDALIGTFADAGDPSRRQNRCFLYHVIGRGTGEWQVPVGGMGAVARVLETAASTAGARLCRSSVVVGVEPGRVRLATGATIAAPYVLANCAPATLARLLGRPATDPEGCQVKVNLVLHRLPRFRSGIDPETGFAGTLHLNQGYRRLRKAYEEAASGRLPEPLPCEVYCQTLTDPSVLGPEPRRAGFHALTMFALHTPARLFRADPGGARGQVRDAALRALQSVLAEPLRDCVALDAEGRPCVEVLTPLDIEAELAMAGGHIFHGDLSWPWLSDTESAETPAERWGVATDLPGVLLCGSGARRGGAVSGLGGHNAAMAVLADVGIRS